MARKSRPARRRDTVRIQPAEPGSSHRWRALGLLAAAGLTIVGLVWLALPWFFPSASALLQEARSSRASDPQRAEALLFRSIDRAGGDFPEAQLELCELLGEQGRWPEARAAFSLIQDPEQCESAALLELARESLQTGEYILPEYALNAAEKNPASRAEALKGLIDLALRESRFDVALNHAARLSQVAPKDPFPWEVRARIHLQNAEIRAAIEMCREAILRQSDSAAAVPLRELLVELLLHSENTVEARRELELLQREHRGSPSLRQKQARLLHLEGNAQAALDLLNQTPLDNPTSSETQMLRGKLLLDLKAPAKAADILKQVIARDPYSKEAHYLLGRAYQATGEIEEAQQHLKKSESLNQISEQILTLQSRVASEPHNRVLYEELAALCQQAGLLERARYWRQAAPR